MMTPRFLASAHAAPLPSAALPPRRIAPKRAGKAGCDRPFASGHAFFAILRSEALTLGRDLVGAGRFATRIAPAVLRGVIDAAGLVASLSFSVGLALALFDLVLR